MRIDTLMSSLPPEPRAFPFRAPGPVLTYTLQATHSVSSEIILRSFVSVPWGHVVFLATLASTNGGCGQEEATIATRLLFVVSKHLASRPCVLFVHLQIRLRLGSLNRGRSRCTFSPVVSACIETMGEVTPGCTQRALYCLHLLSHWTLGPSTHVPDILPPVGRAWLLSLGHPVANFIFETLDWPLPLIQPQFPRQ